MLLTRAAARPPFTSPLAIRPPKPPHRQFRPPEALDPQARPDTAHLNRAPPGQPTSQAEPRSRLQRRGAPQRRPPTTSSSSSSSRLGRLPPTQDLSAGSAPAHAYDASAPLDLTQLLNNAYNNYALQTGMATTRGGPAENVYARPVTGKTVFLEGRYGGAQKAGNPAAAFRVLDRLVKEQKVKRLFNQQRFHERKGMKRKRLRMERWRFRFKDGFKAAASRVLELKKQGW
ncbi:unnamed protein product, partial [Clonostachys solani]